MAPARSSPPGKPEQAGTPGGSRDPRDEREPGAPGAATDADPPETAAAALARAREHARRAVGEALAALRALLDAASLGLSGVPSDAHVALRNLSELLDEQSRRFREGGSALPMAVVQAILDALDQEIGRWEKRAASDPDARAVLRTFLGLREILWEFGFRRDAGGDTPAGSSAPGRAPARKRGKRADSGPAAASSRRARVRRVDVQG